MLRDAISSIRTLGLRMPGPSDDPDEQAAFALSYRDNLATIQGLGASLLRDPHRSDLVRMEVDPSSIYSVYDAATSLKLLLLELDDAVERRWAALPGLTDAQIHRLVHDWVGVAGGYLGYPAQLQFSYRSHDQFWWNTCRIEVDTHRFEGTTRQCFEHTLAACDPTQQAQVLTRILEIYRPLDPPDADQPHLRRPEMEAVIAGWIDGLAAPQPAQRRLDAANDEVVAALDDAELLGAVRAVDRVHTALHSYLHQLCDEAGIAPADERPGLAKLLKQIRQQHPAFGGADVGTSRASNVLQAFGQALDVLDPLRNHHSAAHPRATPLAEPEAELVLGATRCILDYLDRRINAVDPAGDGDT